MTQEELVKKIGSWEERQTFTEDCVNRLGEFLEALGWQVKIIRGIQDLEVTENIPELLNQTDRRSVAIQFRAKSDQSILEKLSRFGEAVSEVHDLYGARIVLQSFEAVVQIALQITAAFGETPTDKEMVLRGGTLSFPAVRNYQKRDWPGVSPASSSKYQDAIHLNRKVQGRIVEFQIVTLPLFKEYCEPNADASHIAFKARQQALYRPAR